MNPAWTIISAFAGALLVLLLPARMAGQSRIIALIASLVGAAAAAVSCLTRLNGMESDVWSFKSDWIPSFGIQFHLAADGLALTLLMLTGVVAIAGVLFSWNVTKRPRAFFAYFLTIIGGVYGVFLSQDAFLLFVCYEIVILPKYMLIAIWGSTNREYGAMKLTMYSIGSSALILLGLVVAYAAAGGTSFDIAHLAAAEYSTELQNWAFPILFLGFAVLAGMWPFHTWAPTGHVAAPTAASMLLAGVVMKLGAFGALCIAIPLFPDGFAVWQPFIAGLAVVGILYGAFTALQQKDLKFVIGYSSVSHMGFVMLGLATATHWGFRGAALQMISHGVIAGLLFGIAGRVVYERTHTRDLTELGGFNLWKSLPGAAIAFTLATAASMGLPGFSGFVAEISVVIGVWESYPWLLPWVALGIIITGAFSLRAMYRAFFPDSKASSAETMGAGSSTPPLDPLTWPEISAMALLLIVSLSIGIYPKPWVTLIDDGLRSPLFQSILFQP
ncbi:MAG: NADH-quinone oxidoreductase subunit M [Verrucomicrobiae bacterium]|nr:NADH-quinone oxidoreductase subunit M [Verrucomicrobiae bacterium]NNJ43061.1 NADH-quinone oxidoreductase subunit M [Akkermansiaceae bacterium]